MGPIIPELNNSEDSLRQVIEVAHRTRSKLIYDRLNLRRWVLDRLTPVLKEESPELAGQLPNLIREQSESWRKVCSKVESICRELGVGYEPAFRAHPFTNK